MMDERQSQYQLDDQITILKALSDVNKLKIIDMLSCGETCACNILEYFNITQPTLSHHTRVLTDCGLVDGRKEGVWVHYSINRENIDRFINFIRHITSEKHDCICYEERFSCNAKADIDMKGGFCYVGTKRIGLF